MATIVVVDDEQDIRFLLRIVLERAGHRVLEAHHGQRALEVVLAESPDAVVTDWMMPRMTGPELIRELRSRSATKSLPIFLLTAQSDPDAEGLDVITKPFDPEELVSAIARVLETNR